jgi:hypothetical protein
MDTAALGNRKKVSVSTFERHNQGNDASSTAHGQRAKRKQHKLWIHCCSSNIKCFSAVLVSLYCREFALRVLVAREDARREGRGEERREREERDKRGCTDGTRVLGLWRVVAVWSCRVKEG